MSRHQGTVARVVSVAAVMAGLVSLVSAQSPSLGELAKKEAERRKAVQASGKVYTNDSLTSRPSPLPPAAPTGPAAPASAQPPSPAAPGAAKTDDKDKPANAPVDRKAEESARAAFAALTGPFAERFPGTPELRGESEFQWVRRRTVMHECAGWLRCASIRTARCGMR